ncbi:hypothetical protein K1X76_10110 [bacterium]|nr:hypothetical protein [bacterium]
MEAELKEKTKLIPITKWADFHPWPPVGGMRHLVFNAKRNGFDYCLVKVGRRVLIDEGKFFDWVDAQKKGGKQ